MFNWSLFRAVYVMSRGRFLPRHLMYKYTSVLLLMFLLASLSYVYKNCFQHHNTEASKLYIKSDLQYGSHRCCVVRHLVPVANSILLVSQCKHCWCIPTVRIISVGVQIALPLIIEHITTVRTGAWISTWLAIFDINVMVDLNKIV